MTLALAIAWLWTFPKVWRTSTMEGNTTHEPRATAIARDDYG